MQWHDVVAWILQIAGAGGAIWGLYSSDSSESSPSKGRRHLTGKGRAALVGVLAGICGFGLNQFQDAQQAARAESERREASDRANQASATLASVRQEQEKQNAGQQQQIAFLRQLGLVQQQLSGLEFSWPVSGAVNQHLRDAFRRATRGGLAAEAWQPTGPDVYFEPCLLSSEFVLTRRPNYSWRLDCTVSRPQGTLPLMFELSVGDRKALVLDQVLDALLTHQFLLRTTTGEELVALSTNARPSFIQRKSGRFIFRLTPTTVRFSALNAAELMFQLAVTDRNLLPQHMRVRSLDPLASFDQDLALGWDIRTIEVLSTFIEAGDTEPTKVPVRAAVSRPIRLRVDFSQLLGPDLRAVQTQ